MKNKITEIIQILLAVLIILTPKFIAPVCSFNPDKGEKPMKCVHMGNGVFSIGIALLIILVINFLIKHDAIKLGMQIAISIMSAMTIYIAKFGIGGCKFHSMRCQSKTIPLIIILCSIMIVLSLREMQTKYKKLY